MDVEHQVLQVSVNTCLCVNGRLLVGEQVVELHNADRDGFELLRFEHDLFEHWVLNHLVGHDCREVTRLSHIPPVVAVQRSIQVVSQTLEDLEKLLLFKDRIFKINGNSLLHADLVSTWLPVEFVT